MPSISYKYLEKIRKEVSDLDSWLGNTQSQESGTANPEDLKALYTKVLALYQKAVALSQAVADEEGTADDFDSLRQDVAKYDYWLAAELTDPTLEEKRIAFTRANAISLKALAIYRKAGQASDDPQDPADDEPASISRG